ncbi:MAG TPA: RNA-binding cell elongation regulator Jag/EloR [Desulfomonilia bacterium]|jgi:spoIIIJ-associated protein|nr:Jag N-terminal domain-containing protein [Thermodesulfobacteriota bacterium]HWR69423.1 RNA-binding cell elongation regulator Jag/EloR [Desulfomonilia bacterium]
MEEDYREFEAKTVDEAIILAMKAFHTDFEDLDIKVLSEGSKGLFGLVGTKTAKILARHSPAPSVTEVNGQEMSRVQPPPQEPADEPRSSVPSQESLDEAKRIVSEVLTLMSMPSEIRIREEGMLEIMGDGSGLIIGKRGQTLDALQFVVNRIVNKSRKEPIYITLDTEGYRQRHVNHLKAMALKMGHKVRRTGQSISLEKMNPYDRRIIHLALKNEPGLNTKSLGEGVYKKVVIVPRKTSR